MRSIVAFILLTSLTGCSFNYDWTHPKKAKAKQAEEKSECLALSSIVVGSNQDLLNFAKDESSSSNVNLLSDCLLQKGYKKVRVRTDN